MDSSLIDQPLRECDAMAKYAFASGIEVSDDDVKTIITFLAGRSPGNEKLSKNELEDNIYQLVVAHNNLAKLVRPATPRDILPLVNESVKSRFWRFIGPVQLLRRMMFVNILFIIAFMVIPLSKYVDGTSGDPLHCDGWPLLINELYFLSAAGIGASFFILFKMNHYIVNNKYNPKYESYYWIRLLLGLIAGLILASLIPEIPLIPEEDLSLARPTLALLGGFSTVGVYGILESLMNMVKSNVEEKIDIIHAKSQESREKKSTTESLNRTTTK